MKNKGLSFIEIVISIALFFISIFPLIKYIHFSFSSNRRYISLEKSFYNFKAIEKQLLVQEFELLENSIGKKEYNFETFGKDNITKNFFLPYQLDKESKLELEISKVYYHDEIEKYEYLKINFMYINNNKSFKSENLVNKWWFLWKKIVDFHF